MSNSRTDRLIQRAGEILTTDMQGVDGFGNARGGIMNPDQYNSFMSWVQDSSPLLSLIRNERLNAPVREIDKMGIGQRVLHAATEGNALASTQYAKVEFGKVTLSTKKVMAQLNYSYETVEDNIERGGWQTKVMKELAARVAVDQEELIILGDTTIGAAHPLFPNDDFLASQDGLIRRVVNQKPSGMPHENKTGGHLVDGAGATITTSTWVNLLDVVPAKYYRDKKDFVFLTSDALELSWRESLMNRATPLGDYFVLTNNQMVAMGIPVITSPHIRSDISVTAATGSLTAGGNTVLFLLNPKNIIMGTWRQITLETAKDIEKQVYKVVLSMRIGLTLEEPDAVGMAYNIKRR